MFAVSKCSVTVTLPCWVIVLLITLLPPEPKPLSVVPDSKVAISGVDGFLAKDLTYREFTFTANDLPSFKSFRVKLDLTSTDQTHVPRVRELRVLALA